MLNKTHRTSADVTLCTTSN